MKEEFNVNYHRQVDLSVHVHSKIAEREKTFHLKHSYLQPAFFFLFFAFQFLWFCSQYSASLHKFSPQLRTCLRPLESEEGDGQGRLFLDQTPESAFQDRRGRQRAKYTDNLNNFVTKKESINNELIRRTDDIEDWKAMIADVCNRPGA